MTSWPAKDPDAVLDYLYTIPLDEGDSVASHTFERLAGTAVIDNEDRAGADVTVTLSGGTDGEINVFHIAWVTTFPRENDDFITLAIIANDYEALVLTGYAKPAWFHLVERYPAFAAVERTIISYWLTDAERHADESWSEGDYAAAIMALAAHNMSLSGFGTDTALISLVPPGISSMKSGSMSLSFTDTAANNCVTGALESTRYGAEYALLLRRNRAGPRVMSTGALPAGPTRRNLLNDV